MKDFSVRRVVRDKRMMSEHGGDEGVRHVDNQGRTAGAKALRWDISVVFRKSSGACVGAGQRTGEKVRRGGLGGPRGTRQPLKELWLGRFEQRRGVI